MLLTSIISIFIKIEELVLQKNPVVSLNGQKARKPNCKVSGLLHSMEQNTQNPNSTSSDSHVQMDPMGFEPTVSALRTQRFPS